MAIANRTLERGEKLPRTSAREAMRLADPAERLHEFDIVVSCTASPACPDRLGAVERALKRRHRPSSWWTWPCRATSSPRWGLRDVYLYTVDDLPTVVARPAEAPGRRGAGRGHHRRPACRASCTGWTSATPCL